ncbi:MAG: fibrobacter succinogenes major paralogous domain-containing protein [Pyrinomonadaceae bacterium]|nr:fibrobacter succinogenes major paralogous domain-containing protein [Sphingobacteriaceae bacterium]
MKHLVESFFLGVSICMLWALIGCAGNDTVTDIDGNVYHTVKIGDQIWMAENLKVTRYRNGNPIFHIKESKKWKDLTEGAYCNYNNDSGYTANYGCLYNWYAVNDLRTLAPEGWHIPSKEEVATLINNTKGDTLAAGKMKAIGTQFWISPNAGATNESKFSALPGGYRHGLDGSFHTLGSNGYWWAFTESFEMFSWSARIYQVFADVKRDAYCMNYGLSVRCIKD